MGRSGYVDYGFDDIDSILALGRYRGQVSSALRGKRGQAMLRDLVAALEAMPERRLLSHVIVEEGEVCALGAVAQHRGVDVTDLNPTEDELYNSDYAKTEELAARLDIADCLAREVTFLNDEGVYRTESPEERWSRMYEWAKSRLLAKEGE